MNEDQPRSNHKWLMLGVAGLVSGTVMLIVFRSLPFASGTTAATIIAIVVLKHLAFLVAVGSPLAAFFQSAKSKLGERCPFLPHS
jgi:hypothetical protein